MSNNEQTKKSITIRDVMTIAAMIVLTLVVNLVTGPMTLPFPFVYLYICAGIQLFLSAPFYLVAANRLNKHGTFLVWGASFGLIYGLMGYMFLLPYFVGVAAVCEAAMIGKDTYRSFLRNTIGWSVWGASGKSSQRLPLQLHTAF